MWKIIKDSKLLHKKCKHVKRVNEEIVDFTKEMITIMWGANAKGISANQIGLRHKIFVMCVDGDLYTCINPEITRFYGDVLEEVEDCLSLDNPAWVERYSKVDVAFTNMDGEEELHTFENMKARVFQHELDHLNGLTIYDRGQEIKNEKT